MDALESESFGHRRSNALELLVYLVVSRATLSRAEIARRLRGSSSADATQSINRDVFSLRKALGPDSLSTDPHICLTTDISCDVHELLGQLESAPETLDDYLRQAYPGAFLAGWPIDEGTLFFREWIATERARIAGAVWRHVTGRADVALRLRDWDRLEGIAGRLREIRVKSPDGVRYSMLAESGKGEHKQALAIYERYRETVSAGAEGAHGELEHLAANIRSRVAATPASGALIPTGAGEQPLPPELVMDTASGVSPIPIDAAPSARWSLQAKVLLTCLLATGALATIAYQRVTAASITCRGGQGTGSLHDEDFFRGRILDTKGGAFIKAWNVKNTGSCTWQPSFELTRESRSGAPLSNVTHVHPLALPVPPGAFAHIALPMNRPHTVGRATETWVLRDASGEPVSIDGYPHLVAEFRGVQLPAPPCKAGDAKARSAQQSHSEGQVVATGRDITASWSIYNDGDCAWPSGARLGRVVPSTTPGPLSDSITTIVRDTPLQPGDVATLIVPMHVPEASGIYGERWMLRDFSGADVRVSPFPQFSITIQAAPTGELSSRSQAPACRASEASAGFVSEHPVDDAVFLPGESFRKTWTIANKGDCRWDPPAGLKFVASSGPRMSAEDFVPIQSSVMPQRTQSFVIRMKAPSKARADTEFWEFVDHEGRATKINNFAQVWVAIRVDQKRRTRPAR